MKKITIYTTSLIVFGIALLMGCQHSHSHDEQETHQLEDTAHANEIHLIQKQLDVMGIKLGGFQEIHLSSTVKSNGQLALPPQNKADVSTVMGGRVSKILVIEGDQVKKGRVLAYLENPDFIEVQQEYAEAISNLEFLEQDFNRTKTLFEENVDSERDFQEVKSIYLAAKAEANAMQEKMKLLGMSTQAVIQGKIVSSIPVRSPIDGFVHLVEVNIGTYVQPDQELFEIVDNEHIHIDLMVYEKDLGKIRKDQKVLFSLTSKPDSIFEGKIFALGKAFEIDLKAVTIHAEIENKTGDLLPGMYVDARIVIDNKRVIALPDEAIVAEGGLNYIFIEAGHEHQDDPDHANLQNHEYVFRKVEVNTGVSDIGFTEVVAAEEIPENPTIVIRGAYYLQAEMKKSQGGVEHHH